MTRFALVLAAGVSAVAMASSAYAADLIIEEPIAPGIVEVSGGNWEGLYLGVFGGYGFGEAEVDNGAVSTFDADGWLVGATLGANFYLSDNIVAGVVGDIAWSDLNGSDGLVDVSSDWQGSVRGLVGLDAGAFMPYITGGLAFANATVDNGVDSDSATHIGWTAGAGVQFAATEDLAIDLQYRYSDYGTQDYDLGGVNHESSLTAHQVTVGLNWKF